MPSHRMAGRALPWLKLKRMVDSAAGAAAMHALLYKVQKGKLNAIWQIITMD
jgi:hypothetical protein